MEVPGRNLDTGEKTVTFCESCEIENSKSPANGACRECKEYMCTTCFRQHLKSKHTKNHVLLSLDEFSTYTAANGAEDVTKCVKHDNENIKFYCCSHDAVGCGDCMVLEHKFCNTGYIKALAREFKDGDTYKNIVKRVEEIEEKKTDYGKEIEEDKDIIERMTETALKEIRRFRSEINEYLDKEEANILSEVQTISKENAITLAEIEDDLQTLTSDLEKVKQMINIQLHRENELFINAVNSKNMLSNMEENFKNTIQNRTMRKIEFVRNENISELLNSAKPFGALKQTDANTKQKELLFEQSDESDDEMGYSLFD